MIVCFFFFSSRRRHTRYWRDWSSDVCSSDLSIPSWMPLMIFAFLFGLSMDYEVFILSRMREEYDRTGSTETAVIRGIGRNGGLVTSAALVLFLRFVALASAAETDVRLLATGLIGRAHV